MSQAQKIAAGAITALAGVYAYSTLSTTKVSGANPQSDIAAVKPRLRPGEKPGRDYEDDHPKPVEDRHGDTVKKHSIAAEKNQHEVRKGKFSGKEFDNHEQKHSANPCDDFEKPERDKKEGKK